MRWRLPKQELWQSLSCLSVFRRGVQKTECPRLAAFRMGVLDHVG